MEIIMETENSKVKVSRMIVKNNEVLREINRFFITYKGQKEKLERYEFKHNRYDFKNSDFLFIEKVRN